ncbi:MAG: serine hydrolase, partial [Dehalococcoidia bacterium]
VFERRAYGPDLVLGVPIRFGMGYGLNSPETPMGANEHVCFWGGWGGSLIVVDLDARLTVAYMMNRMGEGTLGDVRGAGVVQAAYASLAG